MSSKLFTSMMFGVIAIYAVSAFADDKAQMLDRQQSTPYTITALSLNGTNQAATTPVRWTKYYNYANYFNGYNAGPYATYYYSVRPYRYGNYVAPSRVYRYRSDNYPPVYFYSPGFSNPNLYMKFGVD